MVEKLQNPITEPEIRASAKGTISYYGAGIRPVKCAFSLHRYALLGHENINKIVKITQKLFGQRAVEQDTVKLMHSGPIISGVPSDN